MSNDTRNTENALIWVEEIIGGKIIKREKQPRWRPHWFLDVERPDGSVVKLLLRGWRSPTTGSEAEHRATLAREAEVTRALQGTGVKVARYYGYEPVGGWMLVEQIKGSPHIGDVEDFDRQKTIFNSYMENLALLHSLDIRKLGLEGVLEPPASYEEAIGAALSQYLEAYHEVAEKDPEPLIDLGLWFVDTHKPLPLERYSLATGDPGINNFMFDGDRLSGLFDLELAYIGDPLREICQMRLKTMCHGRGQRYLHELPVQIRYWASKRGVELDRQSIAYWTVVAMLQGPLLTYRMMTSPDPEYIAEFAHMNCYIPAYRRGIAEALAEFYDVHLAEPAIAVPRNDRMSRYYELVRRQLLEFHVPKASEENRFLLETTAVFIEAIGLDKSLGEQTRAANIADLSTVLGKAVSSEKEALSLLQARINKDPEQDIGAVLQALFNVECRNEWVFAPLQRWAKYRSGGRMERIF